MYSICYGWAETTLWPERIISNLQLQSCKHKFKYNLNEFFRGCSVQCVQAYLGYKQFKADMLMKSKQKVEQSRTYHVQGHFRTSLSKSTGSAYNGISQYVLADF